MIQDKTPFDEAIQNTIISIGLAYGYILSCFLTYGFFFTTDPLASFIFFVFGLGIWVNILIFVLLSGLLFLGEVKGAKYLLNAIYLIVLTCPWIFMVMVHK